MLYYNAFLNSIEAGAHRPSKGRECEVGEEAIVSHGPRTEDQTERETERRRGVMQESGSREGGWRMRGRTMGESRGENPEIWMVADREITADDMSGALGGNS